jgi:pimeloyl-ACP methyl ester carboxylesterase
MEYRQRSVQCVGPAGLHRMAYTEWGDPRNSRVVVCVHALTRNCRDFDFLARALASHYRVVCPDIAGRGVSEWLREPSGYAIPNYVADVVTLIARLDVETVDWVGISMGGLIGMALASMERTPVRRLVLSDVGPEITTESIQRIASYVGTDPRWTSIEQAEAYIRTVSAPFGKLADDQWRHLTEHCVCQDSDGSWRFRYDPKIAEPFKASFAGGPIDLWPFYERVSCPTLVVRGAESDLLTRETWQRMGSCGPRAKLVEIPEVGHAPLFLTDDQIAVARDFLLAS